MDKVMELWLTTYGPLALGWPVAIALYVRSMRLSDRVLAAFVANTTAINALVERIEDALATRRPGR